MPNVVRFALATSETRSVPGVGTFIGGYLDIDANNVEAVLRARFRLYAYQAVEVGIVDSEAPKAPLPAVPGPAAPDPYPQYMTDAERQIVVHGDDPNVARPASALPVVWFGSVDPVNSDDTKDVTVYVASEG